MSTDRVGTVLGRYRIERALGSGSMGAVYEATQIDLSRRVALKVLLPELASEQIYLERFRREAEAAAALSSPHIVQVTDFGIEADGTAFLVMERLNGRSLAQLMRERSTLPPDLACQIANQILAGLAVAHAAGIVHRDLKPSNLFVVPLAGGVDLVKILDFGIAKLRESDGYKRLTESGAMMGTPRYASPEQIEAHPIDARADLYSVGVILFEMITGSTPFRGEGVSAVLRVVTEDAPDIRTLVPSVPPGLAAAIARVLSRSPDRRFSSATEMSAALAPHTQPTMPPPAPPKEPPRSNAAWIVGGISAGLLLTVSLLSCIVIGILGAGAAENRARTVQATEIAPESAHPSHACQEYVELACACSDPAVRERSCADARATIARFDSTPIDHIATRATIRSECVLHLSSLRRRCP